MINADKKMLAALIILAVSTASVRGEIDQRGFEKDTIEFSKLNTDAFKRNCTEDRLITI
jgi:hypothetical protein